MKAAFPAVVALVAAGLFAPSFAGEPAQSMRPLRPVSSCIDLHRIGEWYVIDDSTIIVRTGPKHYRVDLKNACPRLDVGGGLNLSTRSTYGGDRRYVCGEITDRVTTVDGIPCAVKSVTPISGDTFKSMEKAKLDAKRHRKAAG
jgi:hypothetical protein